MVVYFSNDGHDAWGWMVVQGGIRGNVAFLALRFDSSSTLAGLCSWTAEEWLRDAGFPRRVFSFINFLCLCIPLRGIKTMEWLGGYSEYFRYSSFPRSNILRVYFLRLSCTRISRIDHAHLGYASDGRGERQRLERVDHRTKHFIELKQKAGSSKPAHRQRGSAQDRQDILFLKTASLSVSGRRQDETG
jgi:hypothetical protein